VRCGASLWRISALTLLAFIVESWGVLQAPLDVFSESCLPG